MSQEFLDSICGKTLLDLVARGSAILAQMQRLSQHIPKIFINPGTKYKQILYDYSYFSNYNKIQDKIQSTQNLRQLNDTIRNTYLPLLQKHNNLYNCKNNIIKQQLFTIKVYAILSRKQLICEAFYLFGVMLILMDRIIQGKVRQRILVCYYRNKGGQNIQRIDQLRNLCRDHGYGQDKPSPANYPQCLFDNFPLDSDIIQSIIFAIKDDDIYKQMSAYGNQRSFGLANQASMIWVILFMRVQVLQKAKSTMRQIVDKHFYNIWVIPFYLGYIVDITVSWRPYKAALMALNNIIDLQSITDLAVDFANRQAQCYKKCKQYLTQGVMTQQYVLYKITPLMNNLRDSNICLRWQILHRNTKDQRLKNIIYSNTNPLQILRLLLVCSQFQIVFKQKVSSLLQKKQLIWQQDRDLCVQRMNQLSAYFGSQKSLGKIQSDQSFKNWFSEIASSIGDLNFSNSTYATRKIGQLIQSLKDIQQYHQISSSIQIKQYLYDTCTDLDHMVKLANVKSSHLLYIDIISDITWSWKVLKDYIKYIQKQIRNYPDTALLLKNTFMKLSSILNTPMVRIIEANSQDMNAVSNFYSQQLVKIVKDVLQVIPRLVFHILGYIINIFTQKLTPQPNKFDKAQLINLAQFDQRLQIAKYNHQISVFAKSILNMQSYLLGVIQVNPRQLLQIGLRKQLIKQLAQILQSNLTQKTVTIQTFMDKVISLGKKLDSFKRALQYLQDFVHIKGLKILVIQQVGVEQLNYDQDIPLPTIKDPQVNTFLGWILRQLIQITSSKKSTFILTSYTFNSCTDQKQLLTLKTLTILHKCIGISGLQGLDYLLALKIKNKLEKIVAQISQLNKDQNSKKILDQAYQSLKNVSSFSDRYDQTITNLKKYFKNLTTSIGKCFVQIGHYILLRDMICLQLRMLSKVGAPRLYLVLQNLNKSLLNDLIRNQNLQNNNQQHLDNQNLLLALVNPYFKHLGMLQPIKKVYLVTQSVSNLALIIFTVVCSHINDFDYDNKLKSLVRSNKQATQPNYFLSGLLCFFQQYHPHNKDTMFAYLASYIKSTVNFIVVNKQVHKNPQLVADLFTYIRFFQQAIKYSRQPYEKYKAIIDLGLFSSLDKETLKLSK